MLGGVPRTALSEVFVLVLFIQADQELPRNCDDAANGSAGIRNGGQIYWDYCPLLA